MLIKILKENDIKPSFLIGGIDREENASFKYEDSKYFVIEGDEYDTSFLISVQNLYITNPMY